jgi:hypothetical protein
MDWNPTFFLEILWSKEFLKVVLLLRIQNKMVIITPIGAQCHVYLIEL